MIIDRKLDRKPRVKWSYGGAYATLKYWKDGEERQEENLEAIANY